MQNEQKDVFGGFFTQNETHERDLDLLVKTCCKKKSLNSEFCLWHAFGENLNVLHFIHSSFFKMIEKPFMWCLVKYSSECHFVLRGFMCVFTLLQIRKLHLC